MILTLNDLHTQQSKPFEFTLDFKKEMEQSSSISEISKALVSGAYMFLDDETIRFNLEVSLTVTVIAADTLNPIEVPMHIQILDDVSKNDTEYRIINDRVDLYELVWGWVAAEMPYGVFEH